MHMATKKQRLVVELDPAHVRQLKWVAMKHRITVTQLIGEYSCQAFFEEIPDGFDRAVALRAMADQERWTDVPFE